VLDAVQVFGCPEKGLPAEVHYVFVASQDIPRIRTPRVLDDHVLVFSLAVPENLIERDNSLVALLGGRFLQLGTTGARP